MGIFLPYIQDVLCHCLEYSDLLFTFSTAIAVSHTESKGPTQQQKQAFEAEGQQFGRHLVSYLGDDEGKMSPSNFDPVNSMGI